MNSCHRKQPNKKTKINKKKPLKKQQQQQQQLTSSAGFIYLFFYLFLLQQENSFHFIFLCCSSLRFDSLSLPLSLLPFLLTNLATFCYSFKLPRNFLSFFLKPTLFCSPLSFPPLNLSFCKTLLPSVYVQISFFFVASLASDWTRWRCRRQRF